MFNSAFFLLPLNSSVLSATSVVNLFFAFFAIFCGHPSPIHNRFSPHSRKKYFDTRADPILLPHLDHPALMKRFGGIIAKTEQSSMNVSKFGH